MDDDTIAVDARRAAASRGSTISISGFSRQRCYGDHSNRRKYPHGRRNKAASGGKIELVDTDLPSGQPVDVFVVVPSKADTTETTSAIDILERAPGHRLFQSVEEVDAHIQSERDSWAS